MRIQKILTWFIFILGLSLIQTLLFLLVLFILERTGIFMISVSNFNSQLIYPHELGGFFFSLILIADLMTEAIRKIIHPKSRM